MSSCWDKFLAASFMVNHTEGKTIPYLAISLDVDKFALYSWKQRRLCKVDTQCIIVHTVVDTINS